MSGMRRAALLLVILLVVGGALLATGVVSVRVDVRPPGSADARPFWQEVRADGSLPPALGVWVEVARATKPAVVNISTTQGGRGRSPLGEEFFRRFFEGTPPPQRRASLGSGSIVSPDGYVVTNYHVVREASEILVKLNDQRELPARLAGADPKTDIALLKVDASGLPTIPFGDSDGLQVGAPVMAIGNPFGLDQTVTTGIVSAKERFIGSGPYDDFIQTDASINPGNSGGPLVDVNGALVGINTAIFSQTGGWMGIGFATPVNLAKDILPQLKATGRVVRGYLGVAVMPVPADLAEALKLPARTGALVGEVVPDSPAASAGLKAGDVIAAFQGGPIANPNELTRRVGATPPGTRASLDVVGRQGKRTVSVTLAELRDREAPRPASRR
jgi:serine protease Do